MTEDIKINKRVGLWTFVIILIAIGFGVGVAVTGYFFKDDGNNDKPCNSNWQCSSWSACVGGKQSRSCTDINNCGTNQGKPSESQGCTQPPGDLDLDDDGISNEEEKRIGTNPNNPDSDGDGLNDKKELDLKSDPTESDTDNDGLNDGREYNIGTSLTSRDTDKDGLEDGKEVEIGSNPRNKDSDQDGLDDKYEFYSDTDLLKFDTDGDDLGDGSEVNTYETDPKDSDTDNDGLDDGKDVRSCNALKPDTDSDGYNDKSDLFCKYDAMIRVSFSYLMVEDGMDPIGEPDPYLKLGILTSGNWLSYQSNTFDAREVNNPYATQWINIPDNDKSVSIKVSLWDDDPDEHDQADINPETEFGEYRFTYDITSKSTNIEVDGTKDNLDESDGVVRFKVETN